MDKISPNFYSILILLFSFWFSIFPAYLYFSTLDASDINSASSSLENIDEEDSTPNLGKEERVAGSTFLIKRIFTDYLFLTQVPNLFFQLQTPDAKPLILRC